MLLGFTVCSPCCTTNTSSSFVNEHTISRSLVHSTSDIPRNIFIKISFAFRPKIILTSWWCLYSAALYICMLTWMSQSRVGDVIDKSRILLSSYHLPKRLWLFDKTYLWGRFHVSYGTASSGRPPKPRVATHPSKARRRNTRVAKSTMVKWLCSGKSRCKVTANSGLLWSGQCLRLFVHTYVDVLRVNHDDEVYISHHKIYSIIRSNWCLFLSDRLPTVDYAMYEVPGVKCTPAILSSSP
jgi:hypothetical protein